MAAKSSEESRPIATYIPFKSFVGFIDKLHGTAVPPTLDASVLRHMSGSMRTQLMSGLRFLGLIDSNGNTQEKLKNLVKSYKTDTWKENLELVIMEGYNEVIGDVDLDSGTSANLDEAFRSRGSVDGQMLDKAVRFYLAALREIGTTFSPHFGTRKVRKVTKKTKAAAQTPDAKKNKGETSEKNDRNKHDRDHGHVNPWHELLLQKFPNFDPSWDAEVQKKWLENFDALMKRGDTK